MALLHVKDGLEQEQARAAEGKEESKGVRKEEGLRPLPDVRPKGVYRPPDTPFVLTSRNGDRRVHDGGGRTQPHRQPRGWALLYCKQAVNNKLLTISCYVHSSILRLNRAHRGVSSAESAS